jgi:hypothetical protein
MGPNASEATADHVLGVLSRAVDSRRVALAS